VTVLRSVIAVFQQPTVAQPIELMTVEGSKN
jgi:hypothetical protein